MHRCENSKGGVCIVHAHRCTYQGLLKSDTQRKSMLVSREDITKS